MAKNATEDAEIKPIKLHALRHSHVVLLVHENIQQLAIQERLGHVAIQITLGTYGYLYAKSDQHVADAIDGIQFEIVIEVDDSDMGPV
ncbi:hypothetical protein DOK78_001217 [Enterococcus sp. DIV2402]|uniref:Tyr recombinase domain-containing protein n=1 Tax=Candidatus Enterococcus lowellii TaxID=2230877 RepID=A0ABZ2SQY7_9ENTE|nr:tyrosine-type recombinase/integrase [Enterococcus sp. DIV2402]MBO0464584.1 hypothetical protein [Enterococcus sp. DIV2402]